MNEGDLVKIRTALEKPSLPKAIEAMEETLHSLGYEKADVTLSLISSTLISSILDYLSKELFGSQIEDSVCRLTNDMWKTIVKDLKGMNK